LNARSTPTDGERVHDLPDDLVAPPLPDVRPERLAELVRVVPVGPLGHLLDARDRAVEGRVAHPGVRDRVVGPEREVLRHSLEQPERRVHLRQLLDVRAGLAAAEDVVLELVHHLVRQHVLEAAEVAGEREHVPLPRRVGDAARPLAEVAR
jgi:hypothetical protein